MLCAVDSLFNFAHTQHNHACMYLFISVSTVDATKQQSVAHNCHNDNNDQNEQDDTN